MPTPTLMSNTRWTVLLSLFAAAVFMLSACDFAVPTPGEDPATAPAEGAATEPSEEGEETAGMNGDANTVQVALTEYAIQMPDSIPAGMTAFEVTNNGTVDHNFQIEGSGVESAFAADLAPGDTQTLDVELQPGTYNVYCPVSDHADQGMQLELTVTEAGE